MSVGVMLESEATAEDAAAVERVFKDAGIDATVTARYHRYSAELLPWALVIVVAAASVLLNGFSARLALMPTVGLKALSRER